MMVAKSEENKLGVSYFLKQEDLLEMEKQNSSELIVELVNEQLDA